MKSDLFTTEADLCAAFLTCIPKDWQAYPETCNYDIVLVHRETGVQIGIEAKLTLNAKVLVQVTERRERDAIGPDYRAVLVGRSVAENAALAQRLGIKVLEIEPRHNTTVRPRGTPPSQWQVKGWRWLPEFADYQPGATYWMSYQDWVDEAPVERMRLPEYVPQVAAGVPAPRKLSEWTIQAIRLCITVERCGAVTRAHFEALKLSPSRWCDGHWLEKGVNRGQWVAGNAFPAAQFRREHPVSYAQIEADWLIWGVKFIIQIEPVGVLL